MDGFFFRSYCVRAKYPVTIELSKLLPRNTTMLGENLVVGLHQAPSSTSSWRSLFSHRRTLTRQTSLHPFHATISRSCTRFHSLPPACQNVPRLCLAHACMCCRTNLACLLLTVALPHAEGDDSGSLPGRVAATDKARPLTAYTGCLVLASLVPGFCLVFLCAPACSRVMSLKDCRRGLRIPGQGISC